MPLIGVLIPGEAISYKQKEGSKMGEAVSLYTQSFGKILWTHKQGLSETWGQEFGTIDSKLQIHNNLKRKPKTNRKIPSP